MYLKPTNEYDDCWLMYFIWNTQWLPHPIWSTGAGAVEQQTKANSVSVARLNISMYNMCTDNVP